MNSTILMLAAMAAMLPSQEQDQDRFPSDKEVHAMLRSINDEFLKAEPGKDCWTGFVPLLDIIEKNRETVSAETVRKVESLIVARFTLYSFACEYDTDVTKADFDVRLECIGLISRFNLVRSDTNTLYRIADWLSGATPLDVNVKSFHEEGETAFRKDMLMIYGGRNPPRYPGSIGNANHYGPAVRECNAKFRFRRLYNKHLPEFKDAALKCLREAVMNGYKELSADDRLDIWENFCNRAGCCIRSRQDGGYPSR